MIVARKETTAPWSHCGATAAIEQSRRTTLGYRTSRCPPCRRVCNERTGTPYNHPQYPTALGLLIVLWRPCHERSLRDLAGIGPKRGFVFAHETVGDRAARPAPPLAARPRYRPRYLGAYGIDASAGNHEE